MITKMLEEEYKKLAQNNKLSNLKQNESNETNVAVGRVNDKVANDVGFGSGKTYERAKYVSENADEEMINSTSGKYLPEVFLSIWSKTNGK